MDTVKIIEKEHQLDYSTLQQFWASVENLCKDYKFSYLLSHHDDGVIWGAYKKRWILSENLNTSPQFDLVTLLQCRIFGPEAELFIWRTESGLSSRLLVEGEGADFEILDEKQILWGDSPKSFNDDFTLMREGEQGLEHLLPLKDAKPRAALKVRAYIDFDENHTAYFRWHRLMGIETGLRPQELRTEG